MKRFSLVPVALVVMIFTGALSFGNADVTMATSQAAFVPIGQEIGQVVVQDANYERFETAVMDLKFTSSASFFSSIDTPWRNTLGDFSWRSWNDINQLTSTVVGEVDLTFYPEIGGSFEGTTAVMKLPVGFFFSSILDMDGSGSRASPDFTVVNMSAFSLSADTERSSPAAVTRFSLDHYRAVVSFRSTA
ncbi:hypothetical protein KKF32_02325 [Patescibacteria group bacterium]|nr:hypothetical protein [Patescibacteria group bacterium]